MLTPNGGVFGRNPTFNNVTVERNLTVNGDFTLGDDIVINDTLLVKGAATFQGSIVSVPKSTAATSNTVLGLTARGTDVVSRRRQDRRVHGQRHRAPGHLPERPRERLSVVMP